LIKKRILGGDTSTTQSSKVLQPLSQSPAINRSRYINQLIHEQKELQQGIAIAKNKIRLKQKAEISLIDAKIKA
jgi:hypothetical protein